MPQHIDTKSFITNSNRLKLRTVSLFFHWKAIWTDIISNLNQKIQFHPALFQSLNYNNAFYYSIFKMNHVYLTVLRIRKVRRRSVPEQICMRRGGMQARGETTERRPPENGMPPGAARTPTPDMPTWHPSTY